MIVTWHLNTCSAPGTPLSQDCKCDYQGGEQSDQKAKNVYFIEIIVYSSQQHFEVPHHFIDIGYLCEMAKLVRSWTWILLTARLACAFLLWFRLNSAVITGYELCKLKYIKCLGKRKGEHNFFDNVVQR
jgi:hypothetical protein